MSAKETVIESQAGQIPTETGQFHPVLVDQTQIQKDRIRKTQKSKRNTQVGVVGLGTSGAMADTSGIMQRTRTSDVNFATSGPSNTNGTTGILEGTGPAKRQHAGKLGYSAISATTSNSTLASVAPLNASLAEHSHGRDTLKRHGSMSTSEVEMRRRREADERHARD